MVNVLRIFGHTANVLLVAFVSSSLVHAQSAETPEPHGSYANIVRRVAPSVVTIIVERDASQIKGFFGESYGGIARGSGSGVVTSETGLIVTNYHVVKHAVHIDVELRDKRTVKGRVVGVDPATDLAVVQAEASDLQPLRFADSSKVNAGDRVLAVGAPFGLRHTVTAGVISAIGRVHEKQGVVTRYLQTDASISPGNSGGPLVNMAGEVVGINTAYLGAGSGVGFSIPANLVRDITSQLIATKAVVRGYVGVRAQSLDPQLMHYFKLSHHSGALVNGVDNKSPAAQANLAAGDIVLSCGNHTIEDGPDLLEQVARSHPKEVLKLEILRRGKRLTANVTVDRAPPWHAKSTKSGRATRRDPMLGMKVRALTPGLRQELGYQRRGSVAIVRVATGSPADRAGLRPGYAIIQADLQPVREPRDLLPAIADGSILLLIENEEGETAYVLVQEE